MIQKNTTVVVKAAHINLSPIGFLRYADHFYQAGESFECEDKFSPAPSLEVSNTILKRLLAL